MLSAQRPPHGLETGIEQGRMESITLCADRIGEVNVSEGLTITSPQTLHALEARANGNTAPG
jgi:hypothetical protein